MELRFSMGFSTPLLNSFVGSYYHVPIGNRPLVVSLLRLFSGLPCDVWYLRPLCFPKCSTVNTRRSINHLSHVYHLLQRGHKGVCSRDYMANPSGMTVLIVDIHEFRSLCVVQPPPLVFAPKRAFECGPLLVLGARI